LRSSQYCGSNLISVATAYTVFLNLEVVGFDTRTFFMSRKFFGDYLLDTEVF